MSNFRIILTVVFAAFIVIGVIMFSLFRGNSGGAQLEQITVWGNIPESIFSKYLKALVSKDPRCW